jgi:phosphate-selective porin
MLTRRVSGTLLVVCLGASAAEIASGWRAGFDRRPSVGYGELLQMDFRFKTQADFSRVGDEADDDGDVSVFDFRRTRVGIEGTLLRDFEYELDFEVGERRSMLRDAYVNYRKLRWLQVQVGRFRVPFGRDQNTASHDLDFVFRSRPGTLLAPGRDVGAMLHGRVWDRRLHYQAGVFREDGVMPLGQDEPSGGGLTWAARLRNKPSSLVWMPKLLKDLELGVAVARSRLPEGMYSLRGRTTFFETFFPRYFVKGRRLRTGVEMEWKRGPFGVQGELLRTQDQRLGQSIRGLDLPELIAQGWYLQGTWVVTGEKKDGGVKPRKNFLAGGWGALELAVRQEYIGFRSADRTGFALTSSRASNIASGGDRAWTFGVNWYLNRYVKVQGNAIRERIDEPRLAPAGLGRTLYWTQVCRVQFVM